MVSEALRKQVDDLIQADDAHGANAALQQVWRSQPDGPTAAFVVSCYEKIREDLALKPYRLAILRSFTVEPLIPLLRAEAFAAGIDVSIQLGEFNVWLQEVLDPAARLYAFQPDAVILAIHDATVEQLRDAVEALRVQSAAAVIVHTIEAPATPSRGVLDAQLGGQWEAVQDANRAIRELARLHRGVYVLDYDALAARHGRLSWRDERKWLTVRLPIAAPYLRYLAREWMRFLHPLTGKVAKAVVTDLDNTLWGGVVGEDGIEGLRLGPEYPGAAYQAVQRVLLDLHARGILLAVCSKNNYDDAIAVIDTHPGMLLSSRHFAALRINWNDKAQNLREIAAELNIGVEALAFLDDNPVERAAVRSSLPEVTVIELPADTLLWAQLLRDQPVFERLALSAEDERRGEYYAAQQQRRQAAGACKTPQDFLRSLDQEVEIAALDAMSLARVAQLTQKTNQFNVTTRRYTEQQIAELAQRPGWRVYSLRLRDRFGDNGIVGVAILATKGLDSMGLDSMGGAAEIDTLLLSCRVIGRGVETAFLSFLCEQAAKSGCRVLRGRFAPTRKNAPSRELFASHGFEKLADDEQGSLWELNLAAGQSVAAPSWVRLTTLAEVPG
jgi:FkbH-like protein